MTNAAILKQESLRFGLSILFMAVILVIAWFALPKLTERMAKGQASAFWKQEREENEKRLFGGE